MKDAAQFFKVLADPARLQMLWLLINERELCVCDVMAVLGVTQSKASRHLIAMKHAGLVTDRKEGLWSYYQLRPAQDELARRHLDLLRSTLASRPEAAAMLRTLRKQLASKTRATPCSTERCATATPGPSRAAKQTRISGGSR